MALDKADKILARVASPEKLLDLALSMKAAIRVVTGEMRLSPGEDEYVYNGSTNDVDWLKETVEALEGYLISIDPNDYENG